MAPQGVADGKTIPDFRLSTLGGGAGRPRMRVALGHALGRVHAGRDARETARTRRGTALDSGTGRLCVGRSGVVSAGPPPTTPSCVPARLGVKHWQSNKTFGSDLTACFFVRRRVIGYLVCLHDVRAIAERAHLAHFAQLLPSRR